MNVLGYIADQRASLQREVDRAESAHQKKVAAADKAIAKAQKEFDAFVAEAEGTKAASQNEVETARAKLQELDDEVAGLKGLKPAKKTAAKKTVKAAPVAKTPAPAAKKTAKKTAVKTTTQRSVEGRNAVTSGQRPPLKDAIRLILAKKTLKCPDIVAELEARGWAPESGSIKAYVSNVLSTYSNETKLGAGAVFESVKTGKGRGFYRVRIGVAPIDPKVRSMFGGVTSGAAPAAPAAKAAPTAKKATAKKAATGTTVRGCSAKLANGEVCGTPGHNSRSHDAWLAAGGTASKKGPVAKTVAAKAAKAAPAAGARGSKSDFIRQQPASMSCSEVIAAGKAAGISLTASLVYMVRDKAGIKATPKAKAAPAAKTAAKKGPTVKDSTKAAPAAKTAAKTTNGKGTHVKPGKGAQKCGKCAALGNEVFGHNAKGHDAYIAKQNSNGNGKEHAPKAAKKSVPAAQASEPAPPAPSAPASAPAPAPTVAAAKAQTVDDFMAADTKTPVNHSDASEGDAGLGIDLGG